jgi:hypothetical protein
MFLGPQLTLHGLMKIKPLALELPTRDEGPQFLVDIKAID